MQSPFFWKTWPDQQRRMLYLLGALLVFSMAYMWFNYFRGADNVIGWEKVQEQKAIETTVHDFRTGPFHISVPAENYVIFEYLAGTPLRHNLVASYIFLSVFAVAVVFLLAVVTIVDRFWYFVGMSLFIVLMVSMKFEVLALFGQGITVTIGILIVYVVPSFYYKYVRVTASFTERVLVFLLITAVLATVIGLFSQAEYPYLHMVATAYVSSLILTLLFIITVAHEIMVAFVYITSEGIREGAAKHFSLISFIYLVNVLITCLHEMGVVEWNFIYINLYLLITISAVLGLWGFRIREPQYERIFLFEPIGAFFFLCFASICFITIAQLLGNANDAALKVIRDIIIFSHAGFGIVFFIYFFSNFLAMMGDGNRVYRVLYKPNRMPYFTFRLAGLLASLAFVIASHWSDYVYHSTAGFYNYIADLYMVQGDEQYGRAFYEQSSSRAFQNHRANYALGIIKTDRLDFDKAKRNYEMANGRRPTEYSLANEGNLYFWTGRYFDAIQAFQNAHKKSPGSGVLNNNLGYAFAKVHAIDSASHYLNRARSHSLTKSSAE
ncbi:MAG TPA: hypothetical protein VEB86_07860, partial [Chryseosolibacter sp.]|nr:hypothetical protein [Chryseosolibacter sp.]